MLLRLAALALVATTVLCEVYFKEEFLDDTWKDRWVVSKHKDDFGEWKLSHGKFYGDAKRDQGLQTSQDAKFYSISTKFPSFSNKGKPLVIQFTVKHEQLIDCGGGYVKVMLKHRRRQDSI
jgi:calreticulin